MKKVILDVDSSLFEDEPTPYDVINKIVLDEDTKEVFVHYIFVDDELNIKTFEKKYKDSLKTLLDIRDQMRCLYSYLITKYNKEATFTLSQNIDKLCLIKERKILKNIRMVVSLLFVPVMVYSACHLRYNPLLYSTLGIISINQLLKGAESIPIINSLKDEYEEVVRTNDNIFFTEGPKLIRKERKFE